jgi:hypothetical protein
MRRRTVGHRWPCWCACIPKPRRPRFVFEHRRLSAEQIAEDGVLGQRCCQHVGHGAARAVTGRSLSTIAASRGPISSNHAADAELRSSAGSPPAIRSSAAHWTSPACALGNEVPEVTRLRYETQALLRTEHWLYEGLIAERIQAVRSDSPADGRNR